MAAVTAKPKTSAPIIITDAIPASRYGAARRYAHVDKLLVECVSERTIVRAMDVSRMKVAKLAKKLAIIQLEASGSCGRSCCR